MAEVIRISEEIYKRLEDCAVGFDTPAGVIERLLDFYEASHKIQVNKMDKEITDEYSGPAPPQFAHTTRISNTSPKTSLAAHSSVSMPIAGSTSRPYATDRFNLDLRGDTYTITSPSGEERIFKVPSPDDKPAIRKLTQGVRDFVKEQGGTIGQINSATKKLTENEIWVTKQRPKNLS